MNLSKCPFIDEAFMSDCRIASCDPYMIFVLVFNKGVIHSVVPHDDGGENASRALLPRTDCTASIRAYEWSLVPKS